MEKQNPSVQRKGAWNSRHSHCDGGSGMASWIRALAIEPGGAYGLSKGGGDGGVAPAQKEPVQCTVFSYLALCMEEPFVKKGDIVEVRVTLS